MTATDPQTLIAEALAKHQDGGSEWDPFRQRSNPKCSCGALATYLAAHQAAVIAALPGIAVVSVPTVDSGSLPAPAPSVSTDRRSAKEILDDFPR